MGASAIGYLGRTTLLSKFITQGMIVTTPHIDPWSNPSFAPLPEPVVMALKAVNAIEMPYRHAFDESLSRFVAGLSTELRETATFSANSYAEIAGAITEGRVGELSTRLRVWALCHHARAGSRKHHLILLPRDAFYSMSSAEEERLRANYIVRVDGDANAPAEKPPEGGATSLESAGVFERVPVHDQIYDVLVYTHRNHGSASTMLFEARRIGIVRSPSFSLEPCSRPVGFYNLADGGNVHSTVPAVQIASQRARFATGGSRGRAANTWSSGQAMSGCRSCFHLVSYLFASDFWSPLLCAVQYLVCSISLGCRTCLQCAILWICIEGYIT